MEIALEKETRLPESGGNKQARRCNPSGRVASSLSATVQKGHYLAKTHRFRCNDILTVGSTTHTFFFIWIFTLPQILLIKNAIAMTRIHIVYDEHVCNFITAKSQKCQGDITPDFLIKKNHSLKQLNS